MGCLSLRHPQLSQLMQATTSYFQTTLYLRKSITINLLLANTAQNRATMTRVNISGIAQPIVLIDLSFLAYHLLYK